MNELNPSTHTLYKYNYRAQRACMLDGEWTINTECVGHASVDFKWS